MNWLISLRDQLPLLLVLSPVIGFLVTLAAAWSQRDLVRYLALSNAFCTLLLFVGVAWQFESDLMAEATSRQLSLEADTSPAEAAATFEVVNRRVDQQRAERLSQKLFAMDGTNLWPTFVLIVIVGLVVWQTETSAENSHGFIPVVLLFEATSLGALMAYDLRAYLLASGIAVLTMSVLLGRWGGPERRNTASRFLLAQFCGSSFIMLGFAMLIVAVPWMKIEDSPTPLNVSTNIVMIVFEIQKWTTNNALAFQYEQEVFPWMLFVLSLGFAIQLGLFPFHWPLMAVLSDGFPEQRCLTPFYEKTPSDFPRFIAALYLVGFLSACFTAWLRFVVPLAPELLVGFDWLILIPSLGGALWGALRALSASELCQRAAYLFLGLSGVSLLGCYILSRSGMSGTWLMQQQLTVSFCLALFVFDTPSTNKMSGLSPVRARSDGLSTRTLLLMLCLPLLGFFASGTLIFSELFRENLLVLAGALLVGLLLVLTVFSLLSRHSLDEMQSQDPLLARRANVLRDRQDAGSALVTTTTVESRFRGPLMAVTLLAIVANLFPGLLLHQCEPEIARVFRRFEGPPSANSADPGPKEGQSSP